MQNDNTVYFSTDQYNQLTDEQIISQIKQGDEQALTYLINKYKELVNIKVGKFFMIGAEKEDIMQEGMIGLFKAIKNYNPEKQNAFKTFANICVDSISSYSKQFLPKYFVNNFSIFSSPITVLFLYCITFYLLLQI